MRLKQETIERLVSDWAYEAAEKLAKDNKIDDPEELYNAVDEYLNFELESALNFELSHDKDVFTARPVPRR